MREGIGRAYSRFEDGVYVALGLLLAGLVVVTLAGTFISFVKAAAAWSFPSSVNPLLDQVLLVLLLIELLYTVQVSFREHTLVPEPFLLVGLISVIRRVLVITAVLGEQHETGQGPPPGVVPELAVLGGLILLLAIAFVLLRKKGSADSR